jgi:hypothetical protein
MFSEPDTFQANVEYVMPRFATAGPSGSLPNLATTAG